VNFCLFSIILRRLGSIQQAIKRSLRQLTKPDNHSLVLNAALDMTRSKQELILENALLRQQLSVLQRQIRRPKLSWRDRTLIVLLTSKLRSWRQALVIVQPDTVLRWHRDLFRRIWKRKTKSDKKPGRPPLADEVVALIKQMAEENRTWGAKRIRGELLKLGIEVSKRTTQKYIAKVCQASGQTWATFLKNHAGDIWACDFTVVFDLLFRPLYIFVIIELKTRRVVHTAVTASPTDEWTAQQLREATPWGQMPKYLIHDRDNKYGQQFAVAASSGIKELKTPFRAPKANA
jgi:putative transposase